MTDDITQRSHRESAELLGLDPDKLTPAGRLKVELTSALRAAVDDQLAKITRGNAADIAKLVAAVEQLTAFMKDSPSSDQDVDDDRRDDPHGRLRAIIDNWIATHEAERAERAAERAAQGLDALPPTLEEAHAEIERLRGNPDALKFWAGPESERVIDPPLSVITPPSEQTGGRNLRVGRRPGPDDPKPRSTAVIDAKAEPSVELMPDGTPCPPGGRWCPTLRRVVPIPPVAKSGAETKAAMDRVNDRSLDYKIMSEPSRVAGEPQPSTPMTTYGDSNFFFEGDRGREW